MLFMWGLADTHLHACILVKHYTKKKDTCYHHTSNLFDNALCAILSAYSVNVRNGNTQKHWRNQKLWQNCTCRMLCANSEIKNRTMENSQHRDSTLERKPGHLKDNSGRNSNKETFESMPKVFFLKSGSGIEKTASEYERLTDRGYLSPLPRPPH